MCEELKPKHHPAYERFASLGKRNEERCQGCLFCKVHVRDYTKDKEPVDKSTKGRRVYAPKRDSAWRIE